MAAQGASERLVLAPLRLCATLPRDQNCGETSALPTKELPFRKLRFSGFSQGTEKLNRDSLFFRKVGGLKKNTNNKTLSLQILTSKKIFRQMTAGE